MAAEALAHVSVLVVVPTLNEEGHVLGLLEQLDREAPFFADMCIAVADGGSSDRTVPLVEAYAGTHPRVVLVKNPARLQSAGLNAAVRRLGSRAQVLIRCDAHSRYPEDFCRRLVDSLQKTGSDAVVVPMDSMGTETCFQKAVACVSNSAIGTGGSAHRGGRKSGFVDHGHHAAFRISSYSKVGGYDESFSHNEDAELDCRQRRMGARIYLDSTIRIGYEPRRTVRSLWKQYRSYGAGRSRTVRRHPASMRLRQMVVPAHVLLCAAAVLGAPLCPPLLLGPALYVVVLTLASVHFAIRHRSSCMLLTGLAAATMHLAWGLGFLTGFVASREGRWLPDGARPLHLEADGLVSHE